LLQALQGKARVASVQRLPVSCPKTEQERQACPRLASNPAKSTGGSGSSARGGLPHGMEGRRTGSRPRNVSADR
jgi:hypothetical protein